MSDTATVFAIFTSWAALCEQVVTPLDLVPGPPILNACAPLPNWGLPSLNLVGARGVLGSTYSTVVVLVVLPIGTMLCPCRVDCSVLDISTGQID